MSLSTLLTFALGALCSAYFLFNYFTRGRKLPSLALAFVVLGWSVNAAILSGMIWRDEYEFVRWVGALVSAFLVASIVRIETKRVDSRS